MQPRRGRARHLGERAVDDIGGPGEFGRAEGDGRHAHPVQLVLWCAAQHCRGPVTRGGHDDEVAEALQQILDKAARILAGLDDAVDRGERAPGIHSSERVDDLVKEGRVRVPEQRHRALVLDRASRRRAACGAGAQLGTGDELVEQREGVAHRAAARADDQGQYARLHRDLLGFAELLHVVEHLRGRHEPERVVVRAAADRADDLLGLGRREDEFDVIRRLLDELEQRVEALGRHHVRLVEDEDLVAVAGGGEGGALAQVARVVHSVVARGVDLDDVEGSAAVAGELNAARALSARGVGRALRTVQAAGQDARARRLAAATRTAEQVGVVDAIGAQRGAQRIGHLRLADEFGERLRPIAAVEGGDHVPTVAAAHDPGWRSAARGPRVAPQERRRVN